MERSLGEIFENQNHIELLQTELNTLERRNLYVGESHDEERRIGQENQAFSCRLQANIRADGDTLEC